MRTSLKRAVEAAREAYPGSPAETYVTEERGIGQEAAERHALGWVPKRPAGISGLEGFERFAGRLAIPNLNASGDVVGVKFRAITDDDGGRKYDGPPNTLRLFNLQALNRVTDTLVICEGEIDAITWTHLGVPAVGIPGVKNWKPHHRLLFEGIGRVVFVHDNDDPRAVLDRKSGEQKFVRVGEELAKSVLKDLEQNAATGAVALAPPAGCKDANEALVAGHGKALVAMVEKAGRAEG